MGAFFVLRIILCRFDDMEGEYNTHKKEEKVKFTYMETHYTYSLWPSDSFGFIVKNHRFNGVEYLETLCGKLLEIERSKIVNVFDCKVHKTEVNHQDGVYCNAVEIYSIFEEDLVPYEGPLDINPSVLGDDDEYYTDMGLHKSISGHDYKYEYVKQKK